MSPAWKTAWALLKMQWAKPAAHQVLPLALVAHRPAAGRQVVLLPVVRHLEGHPRVAALMVSPECREPRGELVMVR